MDVTPKKTHPSLSERSAQRLVKQARRRLASPSKSPSPSPRKRVCWSREEVQALVQVIGLGLHRDDDDNTKWPTFGEGHRYWVDVGDDLGHTVPASKKRKAFAIRAKIQALRKEHGTVGQAEEAYGISIDRLLGASNNLPSPSVSNELRNIPSFLQQLDKLTLSQLSDLFAKTSTVMAADDFVSVLSQSLPHLTFAHLVSLISSISNFICTTFPTNTVAEALDPVVETVFHGDGFDVHGLLSSNLQAMKTLKDAKKSPNLVMDFARCIGEDKIPLDRMPFGLLEYQIKFFSSKHVNEVKESKDLQSWRETLEAELTATQDQLIRGPMWAGLPPQDVGITQKAKVNVACVSRRAVSKRRSKLDISSQPVIQKEVISTLKKNNPDGRFWLKLDGTDVKVALQESVKNVWEGDADVGDGQLEELRAAYNQRRTEATQFGMLDSVKGHLEEDKVFLLGGLKAAVEVYGKKFQKQTTSENTLKDISWDIVEFQVLLQKCNDLLQSITNTTGLPEAEDYRNFLANLFKKKRTAASHILMVMISDEKRCTKPYALPIQYLPYSSLKDQFIRDVTEKVKLELAAEGLRVVGTTTDGEFCTLRTRGTTRPLHSVELIRESKKRAEKKSLESLEKILIPLGVTPEGHIVVHEMNGAIPVDVLARIYTLMAAGETKFQAITDARARLVPPGYTAKTWHRHRPESYLFQMRTILATYLYRESVTHWVGQGVDFSQHVYVPEVDPVTGLEHHDRADHCHLLKRIASHTRELRYSALSGEAFDSAMCDPDTGLTHAALVGARKQNVHDAERLLSFHVANFLNSKEQFSFEAKYVRTIADWHEASDGRGLTQLQRCRKNHAMLNYLLEDWIPWYPDNPDLRFVDINSPTDCIRGFSRETFVEVTANIESQECRRRVNNTIGYAEHPRAATTDDVECFFSICHRYLGDTFTLKDFRHRFRKLTREFCKQMDDALPFYHVESRDRFKLEDTTFDQPPVEVPRLHQLRRNRREDPAIFTAGRAFLPARNRPSIRQRLHRFEVGLPAPP